MENFRVTSTAFLAQLMSDPMLREKKLLKSVLHLLEERSQDRNSIVRQMAVRGLGNIVDGAPVKVKKYKKFLLDILIGALHDIFSSEVIGESMKALAKVLKELKEKDIGSSFRDLTQQIRTYLDDVCEQNSPTPVQPILIILDLRCVMWTPWALLMSECRDFRPQGREAFYGGGEH
ncbi:protein maestro-like [Mauremys reevesii]|uniref:protein maestro-like n=1 Tax=Mauremys reevesii TaxID=260615 RepID=UPI001940115C|nr:protein maestro-like [Mauremys reevesii]XP_039356340.1 protein maestro-like [Mauremys reevesii]